MKHLWPRELSYVLHNSSGVCHSSHFNALVINMFDYFGFVSSRLHGISIYLPILQRIMEITNTEFEAAAKTREISALINHIKAAPY